ncbi:MinD/ParA family protein [Candidatus Woesearchaeota archaeon]|nr:MinD/ParA family protein [Candidatus Woesearchaeota archaeon]
MTATTIGVIAIKGGVGKTTTASNLAAILANDFKKKVLVVDANFSAPNLSFHLGENAPSDTIHDVLTDKVKIQDAIREHEKGGFAYIPGALTKGYLYPFKLKKKLEAVKTDYDYIVLDSSPTMNEELVSAMVASDKLLVVTTPDYPTLSATLHAVRVAKDKKTPIVGLILNKTRGKHFELHVEEIENATQTPVLAVLPDDLRILEALANAVPASLYAPLADAVVEYRKLAAALVGQEYEDPRFLSRVKNLFRTEMPKEEVNRILLRKGFL